MEKNWKWAIWLLGTLCIAGMLGMLMFLPHLADDLLLERSIFLPGDTTDGHYQIEIECDSCHGTGFEGIDALQSACVECHGAELRRANDSHPRTKFTDPRNADRVAVLDARWCTTCHQEHRPEVTSTMGLSLPTDYCYRCHQNVGEDRPTHRGIAFDRCASSGCHNFHDNRALYEDFLVEHRSEPDIRPVAILRERTPRAKRGTISTSDLGTDPAHVHDAPSDLPNLERWVTEWAPTAHALASVNCTDCHAPSGAAWADSPELSVCQDCHESEAEGFLASRHGMRVAAGLTSMTPSLGRLPFRAEATEKVLDCNTCHGAHAFDTRRAAVEACLGCHADDHSLAYGDSPHALMWKLENDGLTPPGSGVSCASCHFPRVADGTDSSRVVVAHNQNDFLRPNEKMIRSSCMECHGLAFSLNSLAEPALIHTNFRGRPTREIESIHYATELRWELEGKEPPWSRTKKEIQE